MFDFKLQVGCLIVVFVLTIHYIHDSLSKKIKCNHFYDALLIIAPWAIIFDGLTAYTVNHMNMIPSLVNLVAHAIFFVLMDVMIIVLFLYFIQQTVRFRKKNKLLYVSIPGIIAIIMVLATFGQLEFIEGKTTNYSMGLPVYFCYASLVMYSIANFVVLVYFNRSIEKRKRLSIISFMALLLIIMAIQIILPEVLISSLMPTLTVLCLYINFEDPSLQRLNNYNNDMVDGFATIVENRDDNTGGHIKRTREYVRIILDALWRSPLCNHDMSKDYIINVINAAPLHDIGKIAIPDQILQKPGKLTDEEYDIMKTHSTIGGKMINDIMDDFDDVDYRDIAYEVAKYHHEKWNGLGYPEGLKGEEIPLHARIMAIADVFDAISAKRCYRDAMPLEVCFKIIEEESGAAFDPNLVKLFLNAKKEITSYYNNTK